jgi:hypothetical protein
MNLRSVVFILRVCSFETLREGEPSANAGAARRDPPCVDENIALHRLCVHPDKLSSPCKGGQGGWIPARRDNEHLCQAVIMGNFAGPASGPEPRTRRPVSPGPPPCPPLQGRERKRWPRLKAQQKAVSTGTHNTAVNANFS